MKKGVTHASRIPQVTRQTEHVLYKLRLTKEFLWNDQSHHHVKS